MPGSLTTRRLSQQALLLVGAMLSALPVFAQQVTLHGQITDTANGQPLQGAHVVLENLLRNVQGTISNETGHYELTPIPPGLYLFQVTYIGYTTHLDTLRLGDPLDLTIDVAMTRSSDALDEVVVTGEKESGAATLKAGLQRIRPRDMRRIPTPGPSGDLAGYLQTLPSVVSTGDRGGQLFIRGGTPSQNLILVDGMLIYQPFHILGFFSAFPEDLVSNVDLYAGGFGARYTGRVSSVIDVTMRGGNTQRVEGSASIGPFLTGVRVEGPVKKGSTSLLGAMRTSLIERTAPSLLGQDLPLTFSDWFVKLQREKDNGRCSAAVMHTYDRGRIDVDRDEIFRWSNTVVGGQCTGFTPGSGTLANANAALSYVGNAIGAADRPERTAHAWRINLDVNFTYPLNATNISWGTFLRADNLSYDLREQFQNINEEDGVLLEMGGYVGTELALDDHLDLIPSLALTVPFDHPIGLEPRLRLRWLPWGNPKQELNAAAGVYRQTSIGISDERDAGSVFTAWVSSPFGTKPTRALHALLGWNQQVGPFDVAAEGYYKRLNNLPVPLWSTIARFTTSLAPADGTVWGLDTRLEYQWKTLYAYVGYGYTWTQYTAAQDNFGVWFGDPVQDYHPPHDRRHHVNTVVSWTWRRFAASLRWQFGSGLPYTLPFGFDRLVPLPGLEESPQESYGNPRILFDRPYEGRLSTYHRLDAAMEYALALSVAALTFRAGVLNLYGRSNLFYYDVFNIRRVDQLPLTPYLSLRLTTL